MMTGRIRHWSLPAALGLSIALLVSGCSNTVQVKGHSMEPAIMDGEKVTIDRDAYKGVGPQRGDIIIEEHEGVKVIRRVIGLPGEKVNLEDGNVYVNGNKLDEPYLAPGTRTESAIKEFLVPEDSYFTLGDNRGASKDSRAIGFIQRTWINAKVLQ